MDAPDPHREPSLPAALPRLDLRPRAEGPRKQRAIVLKSSALERGIRTTTCPQCGQNPTTTMAKRTFQYVPPWVYVGLLANVVILAILYYVGRRVVKGELSLCADCDAADTRARRLQSWSAVGAIALPILAGGVVGALFGVAAALWVAAGAFVSGIGGVIAAYRATRGDAIRCTLVDKKADSITLKASETFGSVLAAEAPDGLR